MNKRDILLNLISTNPQPSHIPAAFFLHFDSKYHAGQAAVEKHLEYFRYTDMDFIKIQFESGFPLSDIQKPDDWARLPFYGLDHYAGQLEAVKGLVKAAQKETMVLLTLYSPFMSAMLMGGEEKLVSHIHEAPEKVNKGMRIITDSLLAFVKEAIRLGVDGFYHSTMGGEKDRLQDAALFNECIRPYDLELMEEVNRQCNFNILHICDYQMPYRDLTPYLDYPGHVVNTNLQLTDRKMSAQEVEKMFGRPYMGGLDRHGVLAHGSLDEVTLETRKVLENAPERFILGADCTVPSETNWDNLRTAINTAHEMKVFS